MATTKNISIDLLEENIGQLEGLPSNPRWIRDSRFEALKKSIQDAPEMLQLRELLVYPLNGEKYIIIGGNMRFRACKELGFKELPCKIIPKHVPVAKLREYIIKDNEAFGQNEWTKLTNDWAAEEIVLAIRKFPCSFVILTGGEPTLQINQNLIDRLKVLGYEVAIETNGTRPLGVTGIDWVVVSPKADFIENAGLKIEKINEMKVVFNGKHDPQRWLLYSADIYYLQPCDTGDAEKNEKIIQQCVEYIKKHENWRLSLQTQKILNIR